jgi:hypothetical protein
VAPEPYVFCYLRATSLVDEKPDDRFLLGDRPVLRVTVVNKNGPECRVAVEIESQSPGISIEHGPSWRSVEKKHGGEKSRGKRSWDYDAELQLVGSGPAQILTIRIYMCGLGEEEPILVGEFDHAIWVA